ncbi:hypothetical protein P8452_66314 [Trifolium repens]|nr:hypothetical protein P8452_66314 [Trifolium repens]
MHPTHVPSPHHPSSSNTKKDHVSSPSPIGEASNNFSLLHDNQPSNSSLPLDEPSLDTKKVNAISPSPTTHNHAYELRDFFDGGFSSIENYEMDLDAKDVSFKLTNTSPSPTTKEDDNEFHSFLNGVFSSMQTYQMEFDVEDVRGRIPQCFVREFGDLIGESIILEDPNENQIEVRVDKSSHEWFFVEGWSIIKNAYNILFGPWVTFAYVNSKVLLIRLMTRWGTEVQYPSNKPPFKHLLAKDVFHGKNVAPTLAKP